MSRRDFSQSRQKQHKDKLFGLDIPADIPTLAPRCPEFKELLLINGLLRDGETTTKIKFAFSGGGVVHGGQGGRSAENAVFLGNATTIKFRSCKCCCREILLSLRRLLATGKCHVLAQKHQRFFCADIHDTKGIESNLSTKNV